MNMENVYAYTPRMEEPAELFYENSLVGTTINIAIFVIAIMCITLIVLGAIRVARLRKNKKMHKKANGFILFGAIGLAVAIIAYVLVNWVFYCMLWDPICQN